MAASALLTKISAKQSTVTTPEEVTAFTNLLSKAKSACVSDTKTLTGALDSFSSISNMLGSISCSFHIGNLNFAGQIAKGNWIDDMAGEFTSDLTSAMAKAGSYLDSACSMINGLLNFINLIKDYLLGLYRLMDFLKSLSSFGGDCNFGSLFTLLSQTDKFLPNFKLPAFLESHFGKSERLLERIYGNPLKNIPSINTLTEVELTREPNDHITLEQIKAYSKVYPNLDSNGNHYPSYNADYNELYDKGIRYGQEQVDMQSRLVMALVQEAGDVATEAMKTEGVCSISGHDNKEACEAAGGIWTVTSEIAASFKKSTRVFYINDKSEMCIEEAVVGDVVEDKSTGKIYIRTTEPLPADCSQLVIDGYGMTGNLHYILDRKTSKINEMSDSALIKLSDIPTLKEKKKDLYVHYNNLMVKKAVAKNLYNNSLSLLQETNIDSSIIQIYSDFYSSYDMKTDNVSSLFSKIFPVSPVIGKLDWIIDAGELASKNGDDTFSKNDGLTGTVIKKFPLKSWGNGMVEDIQSHERISTADDYVYSFNKEIADYYSEVLLLEDFILNLSKKTTEIESKYNEFKKDIENSEKIFTGVVKTSGIYPGKDNVIAIRTTDPKYFASFTKPHVEVLRDVSNLANMNFFHGNVWLDLNDYSLWMYLRVYVSPGIYNYKWIQDGYVADVAPYTDGSHFNYTLNIDETLFLNFDSKTNTHTGSDPAIGWNLVQKWLNIGDIWLEVANGITTQRVFSYTGVGATGFEWIALSSNTPPTIAPTSIVLDEDSITTGNLLENVYDIDMDVVELYSVSLPTALGGSLVETIFDNANKNYVYTLVVANLGTFTFKIDGTYTFAPVPNKYSSILSYRFKVIDSNDSISQSVFDVTINSVNDAPAVSGPISVNYLTTDAPTTVNLLMNSSDVDDTLLYVNDLSQLSGGVLYSSVTRDGTNALLDTTKTFYINPEPLLDVLKRNQTKTYSFAYNVTDSKALTPTSISVMFTGVNHAPVLNNSLLTYELLTSANATDYLASSLGTDFDGDTLTIDSASYVETNDTSNGVTKIASKITVTPANYFSVLKRDEVHTVDINYKLSDGNGGLSELGVIHYDIKGVNHAPEITSDPTFNKVTTDTTFTIAIKDYFTDFDGDTDHTFESQNILNDPSNAVSVNATTLVLTVNPSVYNSMSPGTQNITFTYKVQDTHSGVSTLGSVYVNITKV